MNGPEVPVTAEDLAEIHLACSTEKVRRMARAGEIPFIRVGRSYRFYPSEVKARLSVPKQVGTWAQSARSLARKRVA